MLIQPDRMIRKAGRRCAKVQRMRILVVEDEVDLAHDGRQGLWMARTGEYALVVLDLMLQEVSQPRLQRPPRTVAPARQSVTDQRGR